MARTSHNNRPSNKPGGSRYAALAILAIIGMVVGAYLLFPPPRSITPPVTPVTPKSAPPAQLPVPHAPTAVTPAPQVSQPVIPPQLEKMYPVESVPPEEKRAPITQAGGAGQLAIIIDDMGSSLSEARALAGIGVPLTFSIIPALPHYQEVAAFAVARSIEIMIHMPMQSKGWPERRLEANGLLVSMTEGDIVEHMEGYLRTVPKAIGANNHMGSEFTEHEDKMRVVLGALKGRGLFFVDSVTSPKTVGIRLAKELGIKSGRRNVFLDNEQDSAYILGQLNQAVRQAKKSGAAIAICHPHPVTIQTLQAALPGLEKQGITLVSASRLVR